MFSLNFFSITFFVAIAINLLFLFFLLHHKEKNINLRSLVYLFLFILVWLFVEFLSIYLNFDQSNNIFLWKILFVAVGFVTLNLFRSISLFLGNKLNKKIFYLSIIIYFIIFYLILFTNYVIGGVTNSNNFSILYKTGPFFSLVVFFLLLPIIATFYLLLKNLFKYKTDTINFKSIWFILLGISIPLLNGVFIGFVEPFLDFEVPKFFHISISIATLFFFYSIYKYQAFNIKNDFFLSIKTKIFFGLLLISIIPFLFVLFYVSKFSSDVLSNSSIKNLENGLSNMEADVNLSLKSIEQDVYFLSTVPPIQGILRAKDNNGVDPYDSSSYDDWITRLNDIFYHLEEVRPGVFMQLRYIDEDGNELVRVDSSKTDGVKIIEKEKLQNKADRYYFTETMKLNKGQIYVSPLDLNREGNPPTVQVPHAPVLRYGVPVFDSQNNRRGIVIANVFAETFLNKFSDKKNSFNNFYGETIYFMDNNGYYFYNEDSGKEWGGPNDLNTGKNFTIDFPKYNNIVFSGESGYVVEGDNVYAYRPIFYNSNDHGIFWVIFTSVDQGIVFSSLNFLKNNLYIITFILISLIFIVSRIVAKSITKPLILLETATSVVREGDFNYKVGTDNQDEIGNLSRSFDSMTMALKESYAKIDEKVRQQTRTLQEQKNELEEKQENLIESLSDVEKQKKKSEKLARELAISSRRFASAFSDSAIGMALVGLDGKFLDVNNALCIMLGYDKKELLEMSFQEITFEADLKADLYFVNKLMEGKQESYEINKRYIKKDGEVFWIQLNGSIVKDEAKKPLFFVAQIQDISEKMAIDKAKSEFVSLTSHQLRTPLSAVNWSVETLLNDSKNMNKEQKAIVKDIFNYTHSMISLVNSLLNVSHLELGNFMIETEDLDIRKIADESIKELKSSFENKKIKFSKKYPSKLNKIKLDKKLFSIIIDNLLSNAIKYTPEGGEVSFEIKKEDDRLLIVVKDNGCGIPKNQQDKIFTKMFRAKNAQKLDPNGNGLGLYIVKIILDSFGGKISFDSIVSRGTDFFVEIPLSGMKNRKTGKKIL